MPDARAALARTYRPRRFSEVAMQEHVSETLRTAVARGRVAHAYLFCGPRGVGKTTAARVLAMALNCPRRVDVIDGAESAQAGEPCGECESCERIWAGRTSLDVVEIDAASNRGVDDARELRERAMYAPTAERRFKVYIIDEAHMLTREAWNALLKILEEPPPRVIFVFATTEPQKILQSAPPILSRCQRFDFRRIPVPAIVARLREVLASEQVEAGDDALLLLARRAEGGMRDGLSLLDQVLSFAGEQISERDVRLVLGLVGDEKYLELFGILADKRFGDVFRFVEQLLDEGYDLTEFYRGLGDTLRTLLEAKFDGHVGSAVREDLRTAFEETASRFGQGDLLRMLALVAELDVESRFRKSANPRTMLESLLLRFAWLDRTVTVEELIGARGGSSAPPSGSQPSSSGRSPPPNRPPTRRTRATADAESPGGPEHPPAGSTGARAREGPANAAQEALKRIIQKRDGIPTGILMFLATAALHADGDTMILELPDGPGFERLTGDPATRNSLETALQSELGRNITLEIRRAGSGTPEAGPEPPADRLTPERVRNDQLARLVREDPLLGRAVEKWDLELME